MSTRTTYNRFRLIAALSLLAMLLAITPAHARAVGAVRCDANSIGTSRAPQAQATAPHQAGLVIDFGDGRVMTYCIDLGDDGQATGEELLRASNLPVIFEYSGGIGGAVCKIDNVGSDFPSEPCFSQCTLQPGETCKYWSYSQLVGDQWQFSQVGASSTVVHSGDVNGWAWGESTIARGAQPPLRTLAEICLPATATPTASPTPPPTSTPTATLPPAAPAAPPPATATPYVARVITATPTVSATPTSTPTTAPVRVPIAPTDASTPTNVQTVQPEPSPTAPPPPPTATSSATSSPPTISAAPADASVTTLMAPEQVSRSAGGTLRIQLPLIQHAVAATLNATIGPTAHAGSTQTAQPSATPATATSTPTPPRPITPADDPTRTYPYFGGTAAFLLAGWVMLRRNPDRGRGGRGRRSP